MKEIDVNTLNLQQEDVLEKLTWENRYAFACWRIPNSQDTQLIISFSKPDRHQFSLKDSPSGFLANTFKDNHPINPWYIPADLIIDQNGKVTKDPEVPEHQLETFLKYLKDVKKPVARRERNLNKTEKKDFINLVIGVQEQIRDGKAFKIVPSRFEDESLADSISYSELFKRITDNYPTAFCNMWSLGDNEIWAGATPESLLSFENRIFSTVALAGTQGLKEGELTANVGWTQKEIEEQALVSRYIINCFKKLRIREYKEYGPKTIAAGSLVHLCSQFHVDLSEVAFDGLADQMLELLHPTSAVCGMPRVETAEFLEGNEGYDRSFYAGFIGPVNFEKSTKLYVNLRCVLMKEGVVRYFAGAGVTEDSIPEKELVETEMKMEVMKSLMK